MGDTMRHDRRDILGLMGAAAAVAGLPATAAAQATAQTAAPVIEWNAHIFARDTARYPFFAKATYKPDATKFPVDPLGDYEKTMTARGVDRAVLVQPEPYGEDHSLVLDCLRRTSPQKFKATSLFYPKDPDAPKKLAALVKKEPRIVSTRFHAHRGKETYLDSFADAGVRALWKQAVDLGLIVELHIGPNYALSAAQAIRAFPGCKVIIDHLAEPKLGNPYEYADILEMAKLPNVYMKLSGVDYIAKDAPLFPSVMPFTSRVIKEFTPDRMVWGGGTPKLVDAHMKGYSAADIAKVKGGNLQKLLNW